MLNVYAKKNKNKKYVKKKKTHRKNATIKSQLKIQPKIQQKKRGDIKEWVKWEEEPTEKNICPEFLPELFSFLFMKLYRNVYQIKTMCRIQLCFFPLFVRSYGLLIVFLCLFR